MRLCAPHKKPTRYIWRSCHRDIVLTWPSIHHSGCGRNSCTATGRSSPGKQVHLWPHRGPGAGRATFWPTFTHTQPAYMRPLCAHFVPTKVKMTRLFLKFISILSAWLSPAASLSHSDPTAMSPEIKKDRQGLAKGLAFFSSGCALHPRIR